MLTVCVPPPCSPPQSGCPAAAFVIDPETFAYLNSLGYRAPTRADVDGDQTVCTTPFNDTAAVRLCPFSENTDPGRH